MGKFKKVCATIGGAAIISAAIMGMVSASTTGLSELDKSFVYDANYNPKVQIVVGEKASAADVVGAGDIAATIGNLAYTTGACGANGGSAGEVKLAVKSWQMIGKYIQLNRISSVNAFYKTEGQMLSNETVEYKEGSLKSYNIGCEIEKSVANFPMKVKNCNELCYLCYDICQETSHPDHEMKESIIVDESKVKYYEDGLGCDSKAESLKMKLDYAALKYTVDLGGIPITALTTSDNNLIDSNYRGKMLFMGSNDYYVNTLDKTPYITLAKGEKLQISSAGAVEPTLPQLQGYKFKLLKTIQSNGKDAGVVIEIEKPDGTTVQATASKQAGASLGTDAKGHQIQIQAYQVMGNEASIIAYDMSTQYKLEHNKKTTEGWRVTIDKTDCYKVGVADYGSYKDEVYKGTKYCLTNLTLTQEDAQTLNVGDTIFFPTKAVKFSFEGFKDTDFGDIKCSGGEDKIKIDTSADYKVRISYTTKDGQLLNNVRLDEGPYEPDELFLIGNTVYKFTGTEDLNSIDTVNQTLLLTDVSNANNYEMPIYKQNSAFAGFIYTQFNKYSAIKDSSGYVLKGTSPILPGITMYFYSGRLWMDKGNDGNISLNNVDLTDIQNDDCSARLQTVFENASDINNEQAKNNTNDQLLKFTGCSNAVTYIDFYDIGQSSDARSSDRTYRTSVTINEPQINPIPTSTNSTTTCYDTSQVTNFPYQGVLKCSEDTKLWSLTGGDLFTVTNYGSDKQVKAVEICHPTKKSSMTYFIGKEKTEAEMLGTITADDVGKLKKIGCCEATVKSFGLSSGNATNVTGTCTNMKPVGTLMVLDTKAASTGNKIVVGGPVVNTITKSAGVTADEIGADADKYVIKLVNNNTLVVAGWEAGETNAATSKVVEWLLTNAHTA